MKNRNKGLLIGGIILAILAFVLWPRERGQEALEVETSTVTQQDFKDVISTVGTIEPVDIESFTSQGLVTEVHVAEGDVVEEGDELVSYADGMEFTASFNGQVIEVNVEEDSPDTNAQQNQPSLVLANLDNLHVIISLSKSEANRVEVDQKVELVYLDKTYEGVVDSIDYMAASAAGGAGFQAGQSSPTLQAVIRFETEDVSDLIPGFDIDAEIIIDTTTDSLAIPIEALLHDENGEPYVYVVADGIAKQRPITTGIQEGVMIEVTEGLTAGEEVIQLPSEELEDGMEVTVANDESNE